MRLKTVEAMKMLIDLGADVNTVERKIQPSPAARCAGDRSHYEAEAKAQMRETSDGLTPGKDKYRLSAKE